MVLGRDDGITEARASRASHPFVGVVICGIKSFSGSPDFRLGMKCVWAIFAPTPGPSFTRRLKLTNDAPMHKKAESSMRPPLGARVIGAFPMNLHLAVLKFIPHRPIIIPLAVFHLDRRGNDFARPSISISGGTAILLKLFYLLILGEESQGQE